MLTLFTQVPGPITWSLAALLAYAIGTTVYNLYFHPLRHFPGPLAYRASRFPRAARILRGKWTRDLLELTETYGPVVRIGPNDLVYTEPSAWRAIYSHQNGAVAKGEEMAKDPHMYRARGVHPNILSESRDNHALIRRQLSHGFSDRSLHAQEAVVQGYVDMFVRGLRDRCADGKAPVDLKSWFNFTTFDVIGDLAFGEPFGCLAQGKLDERVSFMERGLQAGNLNFFIREMGLEYLLRWVLVRFFTNRKEMVAKTAAVLRRRMDLSTGRADLIEGLLKKQEDWNVTFEMLRSNATLLIIAGSETTATALSGAAYLLLSNPECLAKLTKEVRSSFPSEDKITFTAVEHLPYLNACIKETLRRYPPVAGGLPRLVPQGGAHILDTFVPEGTCVSVAQYPSNHSKRNFKDPFRFDPERFMAPEKYPDDSFDVLQPFSTGPRNCIGKNLAYAELRIVLARLVYNFDMKLVDPDEDWMDQKVFFLWRKPALNVYLTPVHA